MNARSTRYQIWQVRTDNSKDLIQANSRKTDALKRAQFLLSDRAGWPRTAMVRVIDTRTGFDIFCSYRRD